MTSKALEAAMQADWELTRDFYDPPNVADADPRYRDDLRKKIVSTIRAFAQNLSHEAVDIGSTVAAQTLLALARDGRTEDLPLAELKGVQAAIEKDLE